MIGGGHGAAASLKAALLYADHVGGVITVADDGGSSGRLARELGVLPMGDIRNCLAALAPESATVDVFQHRFSSGALKGHVVGNLMIAAAQTETGNFMEAIRQATELLGSKGTVVPPTLDKVTLLAEVDGTVVQGQVALATTSGRISYVTIDPPDPKPCAEAMRLIEEADQLILGPGSLFTSQLPCLLVPEIRRAFVASTAHKIFVCNLVAPVGETSGFDACSHVAAIYGHLGSESIDTILVHQGERPLTDHFIVEPDEIGLKSMGVDVVLAPLIPPDRSPRHDPVALAKALAQL